MAIVEVGLLYVVCGLGFACAVLARKPRRIGDALLVLPLWPLFAPFLFLRETAPSSDLAELLPGCEAVAPLRERLAMATTRLAEIDALLATPAFNLAALGQHLRQLEANDASALALSSAQSRRKSVERLARRRKVLAAELEELAELFLQLETQTQVVRLAGNSSESVSDLVAGIQARLESIDDLEDEASLLS